MDIGTREVGGVELAVSVDCPIVLTDAQFDAVKEALPMAIAPVIEEHIGVQL